VPVALLNLAICVDRGLDRARPHPDSALSDWNNDEIGELEN